MKGIKITYWIATGLLSALVLMSAGMYVFKHADIQAAFVGFGYPTYIIYPLALAKLLGILAIVTRMSIFLKNLAYAGFFYTIILAFFAHVMIGDGEFPGAVVAMVLLITSFVTDRKLTTFPASEDLPTP